MSYVQTFVLEPLSGDSPIRSRKEYDKLKKQAKIAGPVGEAARYKIRAHEKWKSKQKRVVRTPPRTRARVRSRPSARRRGRRIIHPSAKAKAVPAPPRETVVTCPPGQIWQAGPDGKGVCGPMVGPPPVVAAPPARLPVREHPAAPTTVYFPPIQESAPTAAAPAAPLPSPSTPPPEPGPLPEPMIAPAPAPAPPPAPKRGIPWLVVGGAVVGLYLITRK